MASANQLILIVHEKPRIRKLLTLQFERKGFDVMTAATEVEFRSKVFFNHPHLIILGLRLGNKKASDVHDWFLTLGMSAETPVVYMSGEQERKLLSPLKRGRDKAVYDRSKPSKILVNDVEHYLKY